jgi:hypothetical protein
MKLLTLSIFILFLCSEPHLRAAEQSFQVQGVLEQQNDSKVTQTFRFKALVNGCRWLIRTTLPEGSGLSYYEDSYDGENVYHYLQFSSVPSDKSVNTSGGVVEKNDIPNNKADYVLATWLAYGSLCYFDQVKSNRVKPFFDWFEPNPSELNTLTVVDLKRSDKPPFVPTYIYSKDYNRRYKILDFTNYSGLMLPKEFVVECFNPNSDISVSSPNFAFHGYLTDIIQVQEALSEHDFRPKVDGKTYTEDRRFPHKTSVASGLTYVNVSNQWLPTNNSQIVSLYRRQLMLQPPDSNTARPSRLLVLILLGCPTVAFITFAIFYWKRAKKTE